MALYETIFIIRQDVSSSDVDTLTDEIIKFVEEKGGKIFKNEYWGLRSLAYDINNNKKGHYVLLCIDGDPSVIKELEKKIKYSEDVIRCLNLRVKEFSKEISPILKEKTDNVEQSIDVTVG